MLLHLDILLNMRLHMIETVHEVCPQLFTIQNIHGCQVLSLLLLEVIFLGSIASISIGMSLIGPGRVHVFDLVIEDHARGELGQDLMIVHVVFLEVSCHFGALGYLLELTKLVLLHFVLNCVDCELRSIV